LSNEQGTGTRRCR